MIKDIVDAVTIPVMAKVRIGHFVEAQVNSKIIGYIDLIMAVRACVSNASTNNGPV